MGVKIGEVKGYIMEYDSGMKRFILVNKDREEMGWKNTQAEVEELANKLSKQQFTFPIKALRVSALTINPGKVTSANLDEPSLWFVYDGQGTYGRTRTKVNIRYSSSLYEATEANMEVVRQVEERRDQVKKIEDEMRDLIKKLEKPIDLKYFGLKE